MKWSVIHQQYCVSPPVLVLLVQQFDQFHQEEAVCLTIVLALVDGKVEFPSTGSSTYDTQASHPLGH
jgi:hypothetical protein